MASRSLLLKATMVFHLCSCIYGLNFSAPETVEFSSVDLVNTLHWKPCPVSSEDVVYEVEYKSRYGKTDWQPVHKCSQSSVCRCDLSEETSNLSAGYYARVRAVSKHLTSKWKISRTRFTPRAATSFSAPKFDIEVDAIGDRVHMHIYPLILGSGTVKKKVTEVSWPGSISYIIHIRKKTQNNTASTTVNSETWHSLPLMPGETYCFSVNVSITSRDNKGQVSDEKCITLPKPANKNTMVVIAVVLIAVFSVLVGFSGAFIYLYLKPPAKIPAVLESFLKQNHYNWTKDCTTILNEDLLASPEKHSVINQSAIEIDKRCVSADSGINVDEVEGPRLPDFNQQVYNSEDSSSFDVNCTSADSGIGLSHHCLSSGQSADVKDQGYRCQKSEDTKVLITLCAQEDSGISIERNSLCFPPHSACHQLMHYEGQTQNIEHTETKQELPSEDFSCNYDDGHQEDQDPLQTHGYLKQTRTLQVANLKDSVIFLPYQCLTILMVIKHLSVRASAC
nr:PREDICTED: interleukin-10 receptor subunit alpha [Latimeria chalumnae]|eukprot:XP_014345361.1 PREDICTED: interleukin-10 receptor subunit alpha [Latimeria chalumnae]